MTAEQHTFLVWFFALAGGWVIVECLLGLPRTFWRCLYYLFWCAVALVLIPFVLIFLAIRGDSDE